MLPTNAYELFELAENRKTTVGSILLGLTIPLYQSEFELYKTCKIVKARLEQQANKGI